MFLCACVLVCVCWVVVRNYLVDNSSCIHLGTLTPRSGITTTPPISVQNAAAHASKSPPTASSFTPPQHSGRVSQASDSSGSGGGVGRDQANAQPSNQSETIQGDGSGQALLQEEWDALLQGARTRTYNRDQVYIYFFNVYGQHRCIIAACITLHTHCMHMFMCESLLTAQTHARCHLFSSLKIKEMSFVCKLFPDTARVCACYR